MDEQPARRAKTFLWYAIAASIVLHLLVLPFVRPAAMVAEELPPGDLPIIRIPRAPRPSPTPTPRAATPRPRTHPPAVAARPRIVTLRTDSPPRGGRGERPAVATTGVHGIAPPGDLGTAAALPAAPPAANVPTEAPRPTPTPLSCVRPDVPAATLHAAEPEMPSLAQQQGIHGTVDVAVSLDAQSRVVDAAVQSSPSRLLDGAALAAARASQFRTETHACVPIPARYLFRVDFASE